MEALRGAVIHGFLDFVQVGAALINNYSVPLFLIQFEDFRADFFAGPAGNTLGVHDKGNPYLLHGFLLEVGAINTTPALDRQDEEPPWAGKNQKY
jgi:hypothetical protein